MQDHVDWQIPDVLQWNPKWWWDPIPPWFRDDLVAELAPQLAQIQLDKRLRVLEAEMEAVRATQKLLGR